MKKILFLIFISFASQCCAIDPKIPSLEYVVFKSSLVEAGINIEIFIGGLSKKHSYEDYRVRMNILTAPNTNYYIVWVATRTPQDNTYLNSTLVKKYCYKTKKRSLRVIDGHISQNIEIFINYPPDIFKVWESTP